MWVADAQITRWLKPTAIHRTCTPYFELPLTKSEIKKNKLSIRNTIFTVPANGGAPSGHSCPSRTTMFRMMRIVIRVFMEGFPSLLILTKIQNPYQFI